MNPRLPKSVKERRGTARADRAITPGPHERLMVTPAAPSNLSDAAKAEWKALADVLTEGGTLTTADLRSLALLCSTLADADAFSAAIASDGLMVQGATPGSKKAHPALTALAQSRSLARGMLADFGLSPRARSGVAAAPEATGPSPYDEFAENFQTSRLTRRQ